MANYYCKYCGAKYPSVQVLTGSSCSKNPEGKKHALYEGSEKPQYVCKFCGAKYPTIQVLTGSSCSRNPNGKYHTPAL